MDIEWLQNTFHIMLSICIFLAIICTGLIHQLSKNENKWGKSADSLGDKIDDYLIPFNSPAPLTSNEKVILYVTILHIITVILCISTIIIGIITLTAKIL